MKEKSEKKRLKKFLIIILVIFIVLALLAGAAVYFIGFENIKAAYYGLRYDKEEIETMLEENSNRLNEKVAGYSYIVAREPSAEEVAAVESGEISDEQLTDIISNGMTLEEYRANNYNTQPAEPAVAEQGEEPVDEQSQADAQCDAQISQIVSKMYVLRASYTGSLSSLLSQAYAEYQAGGSKSEIASKYIGIGQSLEAQCDGNVNALMSELTNVLVSNGRSTELVDEIYATYNSEKQYTKAYYMNMYMNG